MTIQVKTFLMYVEAIATEAPSYRLGGYGSDGTCDCIGLIIGGIRRAGGSWTGLHGSNYAARHETDGLSRIGSERELQIGEAVYKGRDPGEDKYDLPSRYDGHPDRVDYYHIGVVESVSPLRIRHMSTGGPTVDTKIGKWKYHGWLKKISREGESAEGGSESVYEVVTIRGGNVNAPVNMRSGLGMDYKIIYKIPQDSIAELLDDSDERWWKIQVHGKTGYVSKEFVQKQGAGVPVGSSEPVSGDSSDKTVTVLRSRLEHVYDELGDMLGLRG